MGTDSLLSYGALLLAGFIAGTLNVVAGGGSFLTLPLLIFLGLPPTVANATNRIGVLTQNVGAVWLFHRRGFMDWRYLLWAALPATLGSIGGTWIALSLGDETFKKVLACLMVGITLWTLWDPMKKKYGAGVRRPPSFVLLSLGFLIVGVYSGFIQAGVGFLILAATTLAGLDLVRGNAVKVTSMLATMIVSLAIFAWQGKVEWAVGLVLGFGNLAGGLLGVRLAVTQGHDWIKKVVTVTVICFAVLLWFTD